MYPARFLPSQWVQRPLKSGLRYSTALAHPQQHRRSSRRGWPRFLVLQYEGPPSAAAAQHRPTPRTNQPQWRAAPLNRHESGSKTIASSAYPVSARGQFFTYSCGIPPRPSPPQQVPSSATNALPKDIGSAVRMENGCEKSVAACGQASLVISMTDQPPFVSVTLAPI